MSGRAVGGWLAAGSGVVLILFAFGAALTCIGFWSFVAGLGAFAVAGAFLGHWYGYAVAILAAVAAVLLLIDTPCL